MIFFNNFILSYFVLLIFLSCNTFFILFSEMSQAQNHLYELKIILEKMKNLPLATDSILGVRVYFSLLSF